MFNNTVALGFGDKIMTHRVALSFADGQTVFLDVKHNEILLDAAFRNGITLPVDCREGVCAACKGLCESGQYEQDFVDEDALTESELEARHILSCQTRVQSSGAYYYDIDSSLCSNKELTQVTAKVTRIEKVADSSANLYLELTNQDTRLDYLGGQYARIKVPGTDVWRAYSFATARDNSTQLQFLIRLLPEGAMSDYIRERCKVGDELSLEAPLGSFYLREIQRRQFYVAGGTGLSAFLAMLDEIVERKTANKQIENTQFKLFYCVRHETDACELERIEAYKQHLANFDYQVIVSQPSDNYQGPTGYVTDVLDANDLKASEFDMYLCGPPPMIDSSIEWLKSNGIDNGKLYFEKFIASSSN